MSGNPPVKEKVPKRLGTLRSGAGAKEAKSNDGAGTSASAADKAKFLARPKFAGRISAPQPTEPLKQEDTHTNEGTTTTTATANNNNNNNRDRRQQPPRQQRDRPPQRDKPKDIVAFGGGAYEHIAPKKAPLPYAATTGGAGGSKSGGRLSKKSTTTTAAGAATASSKEDVTFDDEGKPIYLDDSDSGAEEEEDIVFDPNEINTPTVLPWRKLSRDEPTSLVGLSTAAVARIQEEDHHRAYDELEFLRHEEARQQFADSKQLFMLQVPSSVPYPKLPTASTTTANLNDGGAGAPTYIPGSSALSSSNTGPRSPADAAAATRDLPSGTFGRFLILRSGKVKLQLGDCLFDVNAGVPILMQHEWMALDSTAKSCMLLGQIGQRLVATPDFDFLLSGKKVRQLGSKFDLAPGGVQRPQTQTQGREAAGPSGLRSKFRNAVIEDSDDDDDDDKDKVVGGVQQQQQQQQQQQEGGDAMEVEVVEGGDTEVVDVKEEPTSTQNQRTRRRK